MKAENVVCCLLTAGVIAADQAAKLLKMGEMR